MDEKQKRIEAELDLLIPQDLDYLTTVGLHNNNRQVAAEIAIAGELESDPSLTHGYWDDETEQESVLTQWPDLWSLWSLMNGTAQWSMIESSPPFEQQFQEFKSDWIDSMFAREEDSMSREDLEIRFLQKGPSEFQSELSDQNYYPEPSELYSEMSVQEAMTSYAVNAASFREWTVPVTLGQTVVVLNLAAGLDQHVFEPESGRLACSSDWYQKAVTPTKTSGSY